MKLLIITPTSSTHATIGGADEYLLTVAKAAVTAGWQVEVGLPANNIALTTELKSAGIKLHTADLSETAHPAGSLLWRADLLKKIAISLFLLQRTSPHILLLNVPVASFMQGTMVAAALLNIPTAVIFHTFTPFSTTFSGKRKELYRWTRERGQQWVAISKHNQRLAAQAFNLAETDIRLIHNGTRLPPVDETSATAKQSARKTLRDELGYENDTHIILTVARLSRGHKDHDALIHAIPYVLREFPEVKFVWAGDGESKDELQEKLKQYDLEKSVALLGNRKDVDKLLDAADLFVFPTKFEGLPFAVLEAMSHGVPIIATAVGGVPEVIDHQVHGLLCKKDDACDLLDSINWALRHPDRMRIMADNARQRVQEFSQEKMLAETLSLLADLTKSKPRS